MASSDQTWMKVSIGAAIAVKMGAVYVDIKQTQAFFEEGFESNPMLVKFVFAMTDDGTALRESTKAQTNFWIATCRPIAGRARRALCARPTSAALNPPLRGKRRRSNDGGGAAAATHVSEHHGPSHAFGASDAEAAR